MDQSNFAALLILLDDAENLLSQFTGGYSNHFSSAQEFYEELKSSIEKLKEGDLTELENLKGYFAPTCDWDDFTHFDGQDLGNKIYGLILDLNKS
jgi:hypothetical protein